MYKMKILLVDDEADILIVMKKLIESWGYEVISVSNGKDAIDAVTAKKSDIIILDHLMPGMSGFDTLREIRKFNAKIPVIMFTAYSGEVPLKGREDLGINVFIPKSSEESILKIAIATMERKLEKKY